MTLFLFIISSQTTYIKYQKIRIFYLSTILKLVKLVTFEISKIKILDRIVAVNNQNKYERFRKKCFRVENKLP